MKTHKTRWDCVIDGCANIKTRLKFEVFDGVFPRHINFSDVDGIVEINGAFCILEWKFRGNMSSAQDRAFYALLQQNYRNVLFFVFGNPEDMSVRSFQILSSSQTKIFNPACLDDLKNKLRKWACLVNDGPATVPTEPVKACVV